jgi:FeS assembly protein IscX
MNWVDYQAIGQALAENYPDANYATISDDALIRLVLALPGFNGPAAPSDPRDVTAIHFAWVAAAEGPDDSSPYESMA